MLAKNCVCAFFSPGNLTFVNARFEKMKLLQNAISVNQSKEVLFLFLQRNSQRIFVLT